MFLAKHGVLNPETGRTKPVFALVGRYQTKGIAMPTLPIPMISSLLLSFLLLRYLLSDKRNMFLVALLGMCAAQGLIISLAQHYGITVFVSVQPITATLVPPLAWLAFVVTVVRPISLRMDLQHGLAPVFAAFCMVYAPELLDILIPVLFSGYGIAILLVLRRGNDALPRARIEAGDLPLFIWKIIAIALILSAMSDVIIILLQLSGNAAWQPWVISIASSLTLLTIGGLSLSKALEFGAEDLETPALLPDAVEENLDIMRRLDTLLADAQLYLDPDLTLNKISRRLLVPAKRLSVAINQSTGESVSRYINNFRISAACDSLIGGDNVTTAMLTNGFNTKSNFNREFLRVHGESPSQWLHRNKHAALDAPD